MWESIEAKINHILQNLKRWVGIQWIEDLLKGGAKKIKNVGAKKLDKPSQNLKAKAQEYQKIGSEKLNIGLVAARSFNIKKVRIGAIFSIFGIIFLPIGKKIQIWLMAIKPSTVALFAVFSALGTIGGISIYKSVKDINEKAAPREVESKEVFLGKKRGKYHKVDSKQLLVNQVSVPIYIKSATDVRTLIIDFTLEMSNRYLRQYFYKNDHLLKDQLADSMEEIVPGFPLTLEGQEIIRQKIIQEVNQLIKELKIKGTAKNVFFHQILAG